jgi:hypothetical protein
MPVNKNFLLTKTKFLKKYFYKILIVTAILFTFNNTDAQNGRRLFKEEPGMVSYTYRKQFEKDVPSTLDKIKGLQITDIEFSNLFGKTAKELRAWLDERGLKCSSFGVSYPDLVNKTTEVAQNAKTLGAEYVRVAGIPHSKTMTLDEMQKAVNDFNAAG